MMGEEFVGLTVPVLTHTIGKVTMSSTPNKVLTPRVSSLSPIRGLWSLVTSQQQNKTLVLKPNADMRSSYDFLAFGIGSIVRLVQEVRVMSLKNQQPLILLIPLLKRLENSSCPICSISFAKCSFLEEVHPELIPAFQNYFAHVATLRTLAFTSCDLGSNLALLADLLETIREFSMVEELDLSSNGINSEGALVIANFIVVNQRLHSLNVSNNPLENAGVESISRAELSNSKLNLLKLDQTQFSESRSLVNIIITRSSLKKLIIGSGNCSTLLSTKLIFEALTLNHSLEELEMYPERTTNAGIYSLEKALRTNQTLRKLKLCSPKILSQGFKKLALSMKMCVLNELQIGKHSEDTKMDEHETTAFIELLKSISENTTIRVLGILGVELSPEIEDCLLDLCRTNDRIQDVRLENCSLNDETSLSAFGKLFLEKNALNSLSLAGSQITKKVAARIAALLSSANCALANVDVSAKMNLGCCRQICGAIAENSTLTSMSISFKDLEEKLDRVRSRDLIDSICKSRNLRYCNLQTWDLNGETKYLTSKIELNRQRYAEDRAISLLGKVRQLIDPHMFEKQILVLIMQFQWPQYENETILL
jgi:hypothetical protein